MLRSLCLLKLFGRLSEVPGSVTREGFCYLRSSIPIPLFPLLEDGTNRTGLAEDVHNQTHISLCQRLTGSYSESSHS